MKNGKYSLAIVGFGGMGNWHAKLIRGEHARSDGKLIEGLELAGVYDIKPERIEFAKSCGINTYSSLEEILADDDVDIVLCSTPNDLHKEILIKGMRAGKNVVSEKPATISSSELQEVINVSNETGKLFTVHQNRRWDDDYNIIKKIYDENILEDVFRIESRIHGSRGIPGDWRGKRKFGGGMMLDWGVHIIDQILMMINEKVKTVYCMCQNITNSEVEDGFLLMLTFESGKEVLLEVGTSNLINLPRWYMLGKNGSAVIYGWDLSGKITNIVDYEKNDAIPVQTSAGLTKTMAPRTGETIKESELPEVDVTIKSFYRNVIATIKGNETQLITHKQLMRVMRVMETALRSDKLNQVIEFDEID